MPLRCFGEGLEKKRRTRSERKSKLRRGRSHIAPERDPCPAIVQHGKWANMPSELLLDIISRVEATETSWPARRDVVSCASVCRSWRDTTKEVIRTPQQCGLITFPASLKQPGPRDVPLQCFIKRDRATKTYRLYLGLSPALAGDSSKLLLAAKKMRRAMKTEFLISLVGDDFSRSSDTYVGKLRSNFLGTKFCIYDSQPPCDASRTQSDSSRKGLVKKVYSPRGNSGNYNVATVCYELNVLRTRGPRRMQCTMHFIPISTIEEGGSAPTPPTFASDENLSASLCKGKDEEIVTTETVSNTKDVLALKNKAPRWHEQLQCWCLNFKGRVTVASVKNFQLVAAVDSSHNVAVAEQEKVILQFGKIGKDIFTMDYRYPLSAFQAFAICLSSFDTKPACE
jgi:hypothetical protein